MLSSSQLLVLPGVQVLLPSINDLLTLEDWQRWSKNLDLFTYLEDNDATVQTALDLWDQWAASMASRREEREKLLATFDGNDASASGKQVEAGEK